MLQRDVYNTMNRFNTTHCKQTVTYIQRQVCARQYNGTSCPFYYIDATNDLEVDSLLVCGLLVLVN